MSGGQLDRLLIAPDGEEERLRHLLLLVDLTHEPTKQVLVLGLDDQHNVVFIIYVVPEVDLADVVKPEQQLSRDYFSRE